MSSPISVSNQMELGVNPASPDFEMVNFISSKNLKYNQRDRDILKLIDFCELYNTCSKMTNVKL